MVKGLPVFRVPNNRKSVMKEPYQESSGVTVGELVRQLSGMPDDWPVCFGEHGNFTFYRVKDRGGVAQIEFNEINGVEFILTEEHHYVQHLKKQ